MSNLEQIRLHIEDLSDRLPVYYGFLKYSKYSSYTNLIRVISVEKFNAEVLYTSMHHKPITKFL